jgi:hypothetical protein
MFEPKYVKKEILVKPKGIPGGRLPISQWQTLSGGMFLPHFHQMFDVILFSWHFALLFYQTDSEQSQIS